MTLDPELDDLVVAYESIYEALTVGSREDDLTTSSAIAEGPDARAIAAALLVLALQVDRVVERVVGHLAEEAGW